MISSSGRARSATLRSTGMSIRIATSPKRVSRSTITTDWFVFCTSAVARLVEMVVLPMPPLAPKTVSTVPQATGSSASPEIRARFRSS